MKLLRNARYENTGYRALLLLLLAFLILSILTAVTFGTVDLSVQQVYAVILNKLFNTGYGALDIRRSTEDIVWLIRLPRVVLAMAVGIGLSVSGSIMQAVVKNPLADPYILGVSSGAALGATAAIIFGIGKAFGSNAIGMCAFMGAFAVSVLVQIIASIGGRANSVRLLLSGMAISAVCSAFSSFIIYLSPNTEGIKTITFWLMGSLAGAEWKNIYVILPAMILVTIFFVSRSRILNLMLLGDEVAITLGRDLNKDRHVFLLFSSLMVGLAVYCAGMIGFVGLVVPHGVRMILGTDHRRLIPIAAVVGAIFMIWADVACRVLIPKGELPIGILISVIGAPCFLYLLMRRSYGFGEKT